MQILDERFARGDIGLDEYHARQDALRARSLTHDGGAGPIVVVALGGRSGSPPNLGGTLR